MNDANTECRVLVLATRTKDATLAKDVLGRAGLHVESLPSLDAVCAELDRGAGALLIAEEAVGPGADGPLVAWLREQPPWSDLPVLVLACPGADSTAVAAAMDRLGNVTVLERPIRIAALVSALRTALRARNRQYQLRSHLLEREHNVQLLRRSVEEMQTLLDTLPIGVLLLHDATGNHISANRAAAKLLRQPVGINLSSVTAPRELVTPFHLRRGGVDLPAFELPILGAALRGEIRDDEIEVRFDDGTVVHTVASATPLHNGDGRPRGAVAALLDVSALKRTELQLRDADRRKDEFLATLAHELRNPLAPIRNSLYLLRLTNGTDPRTQRVSDIIERQVDHMVRLVDDLLDVSRITRGKVDLRRERIDVATVVQVAVETSRPLLDAAGHDLEVSLPELPVAVDGDRMRLAQVFANLLNNAAKYTDRGGHVCLTVRRHDHDVVVSVRDNGHGIAPDLLPRVFEMFMQANRDGARAQSGLGIGLTLVRSLVEMHGGEVTANSDGPGQGAEFTVRLPCAGEAAVAAEQTTRSPVPSTVSERTILVVDDNRDAAESLAMLLRLIGVEVRVAFSAVEALAILRDFAPHAILLDLGMPGMSGHELARRIRAEPRFDRTTLVALTGWGQEDDHRRSRASGFDDHLVKPADIDTLKRVLAGQARWSAARS